MLPALWPASASVSSATKVRAEPMSLGNFNRTLWAVSAYGLSGMDPKTVPKRTSYSLRRLAPTLANACRLLLHERLPFGNWSGAALAKEEREAARNAKMPLLYADAATKEEAEQAVKSVVWGLVDCMCTSVPAFTWATSWGAISPVFQKKVVEWRLGGMPDCLLSAQQDAEAEAPHERLTWLRGLFLPVTRQLRRQRLPWRVP